MKPVLSFLLLFLSAGILRSQPYLPSAGKVFNDSIIPRVDIFMNPDSFEIMFNDLYTETEYTALFVFNDGISSDTLENIGIRIRGNTSQTSLKKSFKISFNTFDPGKKYHGLQHLHLNGEHNDPCIIRSKLYWETYESMRVPGPRANHVDLYINGNYFGLYMNVEEIDENFVEKRFGNNDGNLYKCLWPADLDYISDNPDDYKFEVGDRRTYELETNTKADDYTDLSNFISILEHASDADLPAELERQLNINSLLRTYAVDVATGNWDGYFYDQNNFYLYHNTETGKFEFISYDTDNTYGIDWFGVDWGNRDIYSWYNTGYNLLLIKRIWNIPEYVNRFTFFTRQLEAGLMDTSNAFPKIDSILNMIKASAEADSFRTLDYGWDYQDFLDSYTEAGNLAFQVKYGLKPYFITRYNTTASQLQNTNVIPIISNVHQSLKAVHENDSIYITAWIEDESIPTSTLVHYKINNGGWGYANMIDDGLHHDGLANDEIYGALIVATDVLDTIHYYITATDVVSQTGREPRVDDDIIIVEPIPHLVFNELMASNTNAIPDEYGEHDDWLELYNADTLPVILGNKYLSDEPGNPDKWRLPDMTLPAGGWILVWCDEQGYEGDHHASFKLSAGGETITLFEGTGLKYNFLDSITWTNLSTDISIGCYPDGVIPIVEMEAPTPGYSNLNIGIPPVHDNISAFIAPNPFSHELTIHVHMDTSSQIRIELMNLLGEEIYSMQENLVVGDNVLHVNDATIANLSSGIYVMRITESNTPSTFFVTKKLVKN